MSEACTFSRWVESLYLGRLFWFMCWVASVSTNVPDTAEVCDIPCLVALFFVHNPVVYLVFVLLAIRPVTDSYFCKMHTYRAFIILSSGDQVGQVSGLEFHGDGAGGDVLGDRVGPSSYSIHSSLLVLRDAGGR